LRFSIIDTSYQPWYLFKDIIDGGFMEIDWNQPVEAGVSVNEQQSDSCLSGMRFPQLFHTEQQANANRTAGAEKVLQQLRCPYSS